MKAATAQNGIDNAPPGSESRDARYLSAEALTSRGGRTIVHSADRRRTMASAPPRSRAICFSSRLKKPYTTPFIASRRAGNFRYRLLGPALQDFLAMYPDVRVHLQLLDAVSRERPLDVIVRPGPLDDSGFLVKPLFRIPIAVYASPLYLQDGT